MPSTRRTSQLAINYLDTCSLNEYETELAVDAANEEINLRHKQRADHLPHWVWPVLQILNASRSLSSGRRGVQQRG